MIERGEQSRQIVGFGVGRRRRRDQSNAAGDGRNRRKPGDRLKSKSLRIADVIRQRGSVGEEDRVELAGFGALRQFLIVGDVKDAIRRGVLVAPRSFVVAAGIDEEIEGKLPLVAHIRGSRVVIGTTFEGALRANAKRR